MSVLRYATVNVWRSEDDLWELVISTMWVLQIKLKLLGLAVSTLTHGASSLTPFFCF